MIRRVLKLILILYVAQALVGVGIGIYVGIVHGSKLIAHQAQQRNNSQ